MAASACCENVRSGADAAAMELTKAAGLEVSVLKHDPRDLNGAILDRL